MKRIRIFLTSLFLAAILSVSSQAWIGENFNLDTICEVKPLNDLSHIIVSMNENVMTYAEATAFHESGREYTATFHSVDLGDYSQTESVLTIPFQTLRSHGFVGQPWIYDFHFLGDRRLVSIQTELLLYKRKGDAFELEDVLDCDNAKMCYFFRGKVYFLDEDHDFGYRWYVIREGRRELLRSLAYEAPHIVQAKPNRYLFRDDHFVYFLSTRYPILYRYSLDGELCDTITFALPCWHPFEDEYIENSLKVPYGVERIQATMKDVYRYSYPKMVLPVGGDYLMYYTQFDTVTGTSRLRFAIRDADGRTVLYDRRPNDALVYGDTLVPFTLLENRIDKACVTWNNRLVELFLSDSIDVRGLSDVAYRQAREDFFKSSSPRLAIKSSTYKHAQQMYLPIFFNVQGKLQSLMNLPDGKYILMLNNELECSGCRKTLLSWLNGLKTSDLQFVMVYPCFPGALALYDWQEDIRKSLTHSFRMLFLNKEVCKQYPCFRDAGCGSFPGILLYEPGRAPIYFSLEEIFTDNVSIYQFRESFLKQVSGFFKE
ncbi:MAG: hypothetical protein J5741_03625 [Bacteroidales bacterium]|nr:hypothetical protein [Bacteroidales bacterium]